MGLRRAREGGKAEGGNEGWRERGGTIQTVQYTSTNKVTGGLRRTDKNFSALELHLFIHKTKHGGAVKYNSRFQEQIAVRRLAQESKVRVRRSHSVSYGSDSSTIKSR